MLFFYLYMQMLIQENGTENNNHVDLNQNSPMKLSETVPGQFFLWREIRTSSDWPLASFAVVECHGLVGEKPMDLPQRDDFRWWTVNIHGG